MTSIPLGKLHLDLRNRLSKRPRVRQMYRRWLLQPHRLHAITTPTVYWNNYRWRFYDSKVPTFHPSFTWVGSGAVINRNDVALFLSQLWTANVSAEIRGICDNLLSFWMNRVSHIYNLFFCAHDVSNLSCTCSIRASGTWIRLMHSLMRHRLVNSSLMIRVDSCGSECCESGVESLCGDRAS